MVRVLVLSMKVGSYRTRPAHTRGYSTAVNEVATVRMHANCCFAQSFAARILLVLGGSDAHTRLAALGLPRASIRAQPHLWLCVTRYEMEAVIHALTDDLRSKGTPGAPFEVLHRCCCLFPQHLRFMLSPDGAGDFPG